MKQPKYQQIAAQINQLIDQGEYPKGSKLPPHRVLAEQLQTTAVTVAKAYQLLVEQRKIASYVGRGSYVLDERLENVIHAQAEQSELNFSILQPCMGLNIASLQALSSACLQGELRADLFGYSENTGLLRHRAAGAKWCREYGLRSASADNVLLTNGAQNALATIIGLYSQEGDCIGVEAQTYPGILSICKYLKRKVVAIDMDEEGMLPEALTAQCAIDKPRLVIVVPALQNPTGATMSMSRRKAMAKVIKEQQLWLVEDDLYAFLNSHPLTPITQLIPEHSFYITSLSKSISPGLRCGYLKVPTEQYAIVSDYIRSCLWLASPFMFELASEAIDSGAVFDWAKRQRNKAMARQQLVAKYLPQATSRNKASYSCWLILPSYWTTKKFTASARAQGLIVSDATYFTTKENPHCYEHEHVEGNDLKTNAIRLSVMAIDSDADFITGLKKLAVLLEEQSAE